MKKVCTAMVLIVIMSILWAPAAYADSVTIDIANPAAGAGYTFSGGVVTITDPGDYTITGNTIHNSLAVAGDIAGEVNLTLSGVSIRMADLHCPLAIGQNSSVNLILTGSNTLDLSNLSGANNLRGISTSPGVLLTISGEGSLSVMGQSAAEGIGAEGSITINSGTVTAWGGYSEGQSGKSGIRGASVTINGGSVTVTGGHGYAAASSGLGGGSITINGGVVTAYAGSCDLGGSGAGIGGGANYSGGTIVINGGHVTATGGYRGAGIGGGNSGSGGSITINGGTVVSNGGTDAAGIGGGNSGGGGTITITNLYGNTHVTATGINGGAGIGGGYNAGLFGGNGGYIAITGGTVEAIGGSNGGAGIGSGYYGGAGGNIAISGGNVHATGGPKAAGIGGGEYFGGGTINISGGEVTASGGYQGAGIGSGCNTSGASVNGGAITVTGGTVNATGGDNGAGVGGGFNADGGSIAIGGAAVNATGQNGGAGIGGGANSTQSGNGGTITLSSGSVTAVSHGGGAGLGGGYMGNAGNITINGGQVTASADNSAPGIGSGGSSAYVPQGTNSVTINAGRVYATGSGMPDIGGDRYNNYRTTNTFNGGSVCAGSVNYPPTNGSVNVYKATITVTDTEGTALADSDVGYSINGGVSTAAATDGSGRLYLWLPLTPVGGSTTVMVSKGATEYSASVQVTSDNAAAVAAIENTYVIGTISDQTLADLNEGYAGGSQESKTIRITNTGTAALDNLSVSLEPGKEAYFELGVPSVTEIPAGGYADFTIKAKDALEAGDYSATVTVQSDKAANVSFSVLQKVKMLVIAFVNDGESYAEKSVHYNTPIGEDGWPDDPQKTGYTFGGWYTEVNTRLYPDTVLTGSETLHAKWTANTYKITFDARGGTVSPEDKTVTYDETYGPLPTPLKTGCTFGGWYTEADGAGQLITSSDTADITSNLTLRAKWTASTYKVTFDTQGGTVSPEDKIVTYDETYGILPTPLRPGHTFGGWYTETGGAGQLITDSNTVDITSDITLCAKWTVNTYKITFDTQGGTVSPEDKTVTYDETYGILPTPFKPGYTFGGWYTETDGGGTNITSSSVVQITGDITLYAKWTAYGSFAPTPVSATMAGYNSILVTWGAVPGVSGYQVRRATSSGGAYSLIKTTASLSFKNTGLRTGKTYYYKVRTYRYIGGKKVYGDYSAIVSAKPVLSPVTGVIAKAYYPTRIKITWNAVPGRTRYEVWRWTAENGIYKRVGRTSHTYYKDGGLTPFVTYYYKVKVYRVVGTKRVYANDPLPVIAHDTPILGDVANVKAAPCSASSIKVSWPAVTGASGYEVWRSTEEGSGYKRIKSTTRRYYNDLNQIPNKTYYYFVKAYRTVGKTRIYSTQSESVSAAPYFGQVTGLKAAMNSASSIKVSWNAVPGRTGYEVYRSTEENGVYTRIKSTAYTYYTDYDRIPNTAYYYKVLAYRTVNRIRYRSQEPAAVTAVSATPYFGPVTNPAAVRYSATKIKITWSAVSGRTGYEIYRATSIDGEYTRIGSTLNTYYYSGSLTTGTTYYYKILAYRTVGGVRYRSQELEDVTPVSATT